MSNMTGSASPAKEQQRHWSLHSS